MTAGPTFSAPTWVSTRPGLLVLLVAPCMGEGLSGSSPPLVLLVPWHFAFMVALYGCGALVCREVAHRFGLGFTGLILLGCAYGVYEEAIVDRYWFYPAYWHDSGVGTYSVVAHVNVLLAVHLTAYHAAVSVCLSVLTVHWIAPTVRDRPWVGRRGLIVAVLVLAATPIGYGEFARRPPIAVLLVALGVLTLFVLAAFTVPRSLARRHRSIGRLDATTETPRLLIGVLTFVLALGHWVAVYGISTGPLVWPAGVALAVAPLSVGIVAVPRLARTGQDGADGLAAGAGIIAFFVLLDTVAALNGRADLLVSAAVAATGFRALYKKRTVAR